MKRTICIAAALVFTLLIAAACGKQKEGVTFTAAVEERGENSILVLAEEGAGVRRSSDRFWVSLAGARVVDEEGKALKAGDLRLYDRVEITFDGSIAESSPAQITAQRVARLAKESLTRERVAALAEKGDALTWGDFFPYPGDDVGSGLMILRFELAEGGTLWVGGTPAEEKPWYIRLCRGENLENYMELREADLEKYLAGEGILLRARAEDDPAAIMAEGQVYLLAEAPMPAEVEESAIFGRTTSYTDGWPGQDGETNFSRELDLPYARVEGGIAVRYGNEWYLCKPEK